MNDEIQSLIILIELQDRHFGRTTIFYYHFIYDFLKKDVSNIFSEIFKNFKASKKAH